MPTFSNNSWGTFSYTVPAGATNVNFSFAGAGGGGSKPVGGEWYIENGASGRAGNFTINSRSYAYTLTFYLGRRGFDGFNNRGSGYGSGGTGGTSPIAPGGDGHRSGGGGGGASAVYDSGVNRYVAWCAGGGGAGRFHPDTGYSSQGLYSGGAGIGGGATSNQGGGPSWRTGGNAPFGHRGGGGGGSTLGVFGGSAGSATYSGFSGIGGNSGWWDQGDIGWIVNSGYANIGNGWMVLSYTLPPPQITYFHFKQNGANSTTVNLIEGENVDIEWAVDGSRNMSGITLTDFGYIAPSTTSNSFTVTPQSDQQGGNIGTKTYTLEVTGSGGVVSSSITATIYEIPSVNFTSNAPANTITRGQSVQLSWTTDGYASTAQLSPNLGAQNLSGNITLVPTETTLYTFSVGGLAGTASAELLITVNQPPTVDLIGPFTTDYGNDIVLQYDYSNAVNTSTETTNVDNSGPNITTTPLSNVSVSITRYIQPGLSGTEGHPLESLKYIVDISGGSNPTMTVGISDTQMRASGLIDPNGSIALTSGYPKLVSANQYEVAFDMISSVNSSQRQATFVRSFFLTITADGGSPDGGALEMQKDGNGYVQIATLGGGNVGGTYTVTADQLYDDFGARQVDFRLTVYGMGSLQGTDSATTTINIDELPDQLSIPSSEDKFLDEEPVITPDVTLTSEQLYIDDIDIPVEIKSDTPIQVEIDDDGTWRNIRSI
ncbi:virion structural protein [Synechococcus phage S-CAM1]|jgi:hypothetical protein|uniref:Virion structural protein n=1 Tax=Synechococcus phage S-CAM1 TaxID=754037 RepID=A0A1D8KHA5_9CAUD|nr:virion structural protein [Synechococcus phage S-CAM1]